MKKFILFLIGALSLTFATPSFSQALTDGKYSSDITVYSGETSNTYAYTFYVINGIVSQTNKPAVAVTKSLGSETVYSWLNKGGIWTESQTFVFSINRETGQIYVVLSRIVQNEGEDPWATFGTGIVYKN